MRSKGADLVNDRRGALREGLVEALGGRAHPHARGGLRHGNDASAPVAAIRAGAREYIPLPPDPELIAAVIEAVSTRQPGLRVPRRGHGARRAPGRADRPLGGLDPRHPGESGSGKEVIAASCTQKSQPGDKPSSP